MPSDPQSFLGGYVRSLGSGGSYRTGIAPVAPPPSPVASSLRLRRPEPDEDEAFGSSDASSMFNTGMDMLQAGQGKMEDLIYSSYSARKAADRAKRLGRLDSQAARSNSFFGIANDAIGLAGGIYSSYSSGLRSRSGQQQGGGTKPSTSRTSGWA